MLWSITKHFSHAKCILINCKIAFYIHIHCTLHSLELLFSVCSFLSFSRECTATNCNSHSSLFPIPSIPLCLSSHFWAMMTLSTCFVRLFSKPHERIPSAVSRATHQQQRKPASHDMEDSSTYIEASLCKTIE